MRTSMDALRSMKRYVALTLGAPWEVRFWGDEGGFGLPFALVKLIGATVYSGPANFADAVQPINVYCYTEPGATVEASLMNALAVEDLLFAGFRKGVDLGRPMRVPLYDYDGVPLDGPDAGSDVRHPSDHLRVSDFQVNRLPDPQSDRVLVVSAEMRVTWRRPTRTFPGNTVESIETNLDAVGG